MRFSCLVGGALLLSFVMLDVIATVMTKSGGYLTHHVTPRLWRWGCLPCGDRGWHRYRSRLGIAVIMSTVIAWIVLFWVGWTLVFNGTEAAVIHTKTEVPATFVQRAYFAGFTVSTLGMGDFSPGGDAWRVLTVVASMTGFFLVTFVITYMIPVMQAATHKRAVAVLIAAIGESPERIVLCCWNGKHLRALETHLTELARALALIEQRHLAYPVLHYMHSVHRPESIAVSVATLDEAMTIVEHGVQDAGGVDRAILAHTRQITTQYLMTLSKRHASPSERPPPPPRLEELAQKGIPVVAHDEWTERLSRLGERRRLLRGLVCADGWSWEDTRLELDPPAPHVSLGTSSGSSPSYG